MISDYNDDEKCELLLKLKEQNTIINKAKLKLNVTQKLNEALMEKNEKMKAIQIECKLWKKRYLNKLFKTDHKLWNAMDIVTWIINLNKDKYKKYADDLYYNMIDEEIDGSSFACNTWVE